MKLKSVGFSPGNSNPLIVSLLLAFLSTLFSPSARAQTTLVNGASQGGTLAINTTNSYIFDATTGDAIILRMGSSGFTTPRIDLYNPVGTRIGTFASSGAHDAVLYVQATNTGTFSVQVSANFGGASGTYTLTLAQMPEAFVVSPGDQGGTLTNGAMVPGTISLGDLDMWSFPATNGDAIILRMSSSGFTTPRIDLYNPLGKLVGTFASSGAHDAVLYLQATNTGTFTAITSSDFLDGSGTYTLTLAQMPEAFVVSPGDQGGTLTNGAVATGTISLGDLDMWSFAANAGDSLILRMGSSGFTTPRIDLYSPLGKLVGTFASSGAHDAVLYAQATNTGTFTAIASSDFLDGTGTYTLTLAQMPEAFVVSPGDEGGTLTNGAVTPGTISLGDLDMWSFQANSGDNIVLRMGSSGFTTPRIDLYSPAGVLVGTFESNGAHDAVVSAVATNSGTFTAIVSSHFLDGAGTYTLILAKMPGTFVLSPGDQGGGMTGSGSYNGHIAVGDLDIWVFTACKGDAINLQLYTTNFNGNLHLYGPTGALLAKSDGATADTIAYTATNSGAFTVLVSSFFIDGTGDYQLNGNGLADGLKLCVPTIAGTNGNLGGVGGFVNAPFVLFTHTNVSASFALWTPILTNVFDSFGVFSHTNLFNPADPQRFFRLRSP